MLIRTFTSAIRGIDACTITIEVNITQGIRFIIVGLADHAIRESQQRIESALTSNGYDWPRFRVVINLAPADIRKEGSHFDLPLAVGILAASGQVSTSKLEKYQFLGELSLDGSVQPVKGVLPMVLSARESGFSGVLVPEANIEEAALVTQMQIIPVAGISEAAEFLDRSPDEVLDRRTPGVTLPAPTGDHGLDFSEVKGQEMVKRAMLIAAAGNHNILLMGPPGAGKTMLASRLITILPPLSMEEALQTTKVHSVAGRIPGKGHLVTRRPFRTPHHSISDIALIGGGTTPRPGEISLAHNGVLFLDELPEFKRHVLEVLRQPLEDREIEVSRAGYSVVYPASFMLVASMNPCPCGFLTHPDRDCSCGPGLIRKYLARISGPLLDRIDMHMDMVPVPFQELSGRSKTLSSLNMQDLVLRAREVQESRFRDSDLIFNNAQMGTAAVEQHCQLDPAGQSILRNAIVRLGLSARAYSRILRLARTIADLDCSDRINVSHISEAVAYRTLDRNVRY